MIQVHVARNTSRGVEYLALKRADTLIRYPGIWQVITGGIESGETAPEAALRELEEEAGLVPKEFFSLPFVASFFSQRENRVQHVPVFAAIVSEAEVVRLSSEHTEYRWLAYEDILALLPFPSHKDATKIFREYIIEGKESDLFRVPL
jgi:8-oxo-dGTP pyrophosphatase MutT (NUDIX family)